MHATVILASNVLLEARRSGLPWLALASIAAAVVLAAFLSQVALTESLQLQAALTAALLRACGVFLVVLAVASSTARAPRKLTRAVSTGSRSECSVELSAAR